MSQKGAKEELKSERKAKKAPFGIVHKIIKSVNLPRANCSGCRKHQTASPR